MRVIGNGGDFRANCMCVKLDEMIPDARKLRILTFDQMKQITLSGIWKKYYEDITEFPLFYVPKCNIHLELKKYI